MKKEHYFILKSFLVWRLSTFFAAIAVVNYLPVFSENFLAGRISKYITNPLFWGWANFDGEHYLSIALYGYKNLQQAFFPAYPTLINSVSYFFGTGLEHYLLSGLIVSNILFFASLVLFWKIIRLDFSESIAKLSIIALLVFPTSFYFGAVYTESLFLFSSLLTYYFYRKDKFLLSGLFGILMTATRIYGVFVLVMIIVEILNKKFKLFEFLRQKKYLIFISFLGLFGYMFYCWKNYGDALAFYNLQTLVGEQHQKGIVLLPQVLYRYIKMIFSGAMPILTMQTLILEFLTGILFIIVPIYGYFKKVKLSYLIYILLGFLVPSVQGSFSSVPRYMVVIFPAFIIIGMFLEHKPKVVKTMIYVLSAIWMLINCGLFIRGYWVA